MPCGSRPGPSTDNLFADLRGRRLRFDRLASLLDLPPDATAGMVAADLTAPDSPARRAIAQLMIQAAMLHTDIGMAPPEDLAPAAGVPHHGHGHRPARRPRVSRQQPLRALGHRARSHGAGAARDGGHVGGAPLVSRDDRESAGQSHLRVPAALAGHGAGHHAGRCQNLAVQRRGVRESGGAGRAGSRRCDRQRCQSRRGRDPAGSGRTVPAPRPRAGSRVRTKRACGSGASSS